MLPSLLIHDVIEVTPPRGETLATRFAAVYRERGNAVAVTLGEESVTYAELEAYSEQIAAGLQATGLPANALVAIYMDRSIDMVAAMLGVVRAGAAYLPLDPGFPESRVRETLEDARPFAVLADAAQAQKLSAVEGVVRVSDLLAQPPREPRAVEVDADDLAYVIYTSGSTGKPKGVMVSHGNVLRLLNETAAWFSFDEHDVWTMFHSFAFDFSVWEMWGSLLTGGRLVLVPFPVSRSPDEFRALLAQEAVTVLNQTPTAFSLLMQADARAAADDLKLRYVIFGGEALNLRSLLPWFARHGDNSPQLINMYGITETTVHVTYRRIRSAEAETETDSLIGEPIPDLQIHLLDDALRPVAEGDAGEICIGGPGVALGYLNRPELTAERFVADPFSAGRLYRSGDLARRRADGELAYLGRADRQVKISGFRIELGEVEAVLLACAGIAQTCVTAHKDASGMQRLAAYFVAADESFNTSTVKAFAEEQLPAHMRPSFYMQLASLPMNGNGKIDQKALPQPHQQPVTAAYSTSGWSAMEQKVAALWKAVLGTATVSRCDNFFDVGGSSLLLISLRAELQTTLSMTIPVTWMFEHTTVEALAAKLEREQKGAKPAVANAANSDRAEQQRNSFARMRALRGGVR